MYKKYLLCLFLYGYKIKVFSYVLYDFLLLILYRSYCAYPKATGSEIRTQKRLRTDCDTEYGRNHPFRSARHAYPVR